MVRETGSLLEDYSVVCEAASRLVASRRDLAEGGLEVASTDDGGYEVRDKGLLVFRCRPGDRPDVFRPGEWAVRLVNTARSEQAEM